MDSKLIDLICLDSEPAGRPRGLPRHKYRSFEAVEVVHKPFCYSECLPETSSTFMKTRFDRWRAPTGILSHRETAYYLPVP